MMGFPFFALEKIFGDLKAMKRITTLDNHNKFQQTTQAILCAKRGEYLISILSDVALTPKNI